MPESRVFWIVNQYAGSPRHGMEYRHYYLAKELVRAGHQVVIISGSYSHLYQVQPEVKGNFTFEKIDGITYCWVKVPSYGRSVSLKRFVNMIIFAMKLRLLPLHQFPKPHSILVSSPSLFPLKVINHFCRKLKARFIFEVRDIWPLTLQELAGLSPSHPLIQLMSYYEKYGYRNADKVVSVLPGAKERMMSRGMEESKFICIPNGIDLEEFLSIRPLPTDVISKIPKNKFVLGYAGTIGMANAIHDLIEAARILKDDHRFHFVITGQGVEKQKLLDEAKDLSNVTFLDPIAKAMIPSLLTHFDVCFIGWRKENLYRFGISANKLYDYMYASKPILHAVQAFNDPVKEAGCGVSVEPENAKAIVDGLLQLSAMSPEERLKMGQSGKKFVELFHSYKSLAEKLATII
jgi:glycosyltransferase involved in cell wall biosynthesis